LVGFGGDLAKYWCRSCERELPKSKAKKHFTGPDHEMNIDVVRDWVLMHNSRQVNCGRTNHCKLHVYFDSGQQHQTANSHNWAGVSEVADTVGQYLSLIQIAC
jgi:hypothetical protein